MAVLIDSKTRNRRLSARQLSDNTGIRLNTVYKYLKRFHDRGLADRIKSAQGVFMYMAADTVRLDDLGGVASTTLNDVLDTDGMIWEDRKTKVILEGTVSDMLRAGCSEASKRDRASWRSNKGGSFSVSISKKGVCMITIRDRQSWESEFRTWCKKLHVDPNPIIKRLVEHVSQGQGRLEVPIIAPNVKEAKVQAEITSKVNDDYTVKSNINYSKNMVGWEISGPNDFLDLMVSQLVILQHGVALRDASSKKAKDENLDYFG